jgi:cell wall-associated NlpC family hydrolase
MKNVRRSVLEKAVTGTFLCIFMMFRGTASAELYNLKVMQEEAAANSVSSTVKTPEKKNAVNRDKSKTKKTKSDSKRDIIVNAAMSLLGQDYWPGGTGGDQDYGYDCSGLTQFAYMKAGINIPKQCHAQYAAAIVIQPQNLKKGDLIFFNTEGNGPGHVGIFLGNGEFIHSPSIGKQVQISNLSKPYWRDRFFAAATYIR